MATCSKSMQLSNNHRQHDGKNETLTFSAGFWHVLDWLWFSASFEQKIQLAQVITRLESKQGIIQRYVAGEPSCPGSWMHRYPDPIIGILVIWNQCTLHIITLHSIRLHCDPAAAWENVYLFFRLHTCRCWTHMIIWRFPKNRATPSHPLIPGIFPWPSSGSKPRSVPCCWTDTSSTCGSMWWWPRCSAEIGWGIRWTTKDVCS